MSDFDSQILYFYDKSPTKAQIRGLAGMYGVSEDKIIDVLNKNGREIPEKQTRKAKCRPSQAENVKNESQISNENVKSENKILNGEPVFQIPTCVMETIEKRMHELETDIKNHQDMVRILEAEYKAHANFLLQSPFEQRNLSHSCSDDKVESPQAMA